MGHTIGKDGHAGPAAAQSVAGTESTGTLQELRVDSDGHLQVDVLSSSSPSGTQDVNILQIGSTAVGDHDAAVIAEGIQPILEAKDFDGSALPNAVGTEGDGVRQAASLSGVAYSMLVTEDGSKTPVNQSSGFVDVTEQDPVDQHYTNLAINVDTTNVAGAPTDHYYPGATGATMDGRKDLSISGKLVITTDTLTLSVEAMNDEDTASGDWIQVYGYDDKNNTTANSWTVTNGTLTFAISFNNMNYRYYRVKLNATGATNTVIIKGRTKAL
jgi:hypothetical protein